MENREYKKFVKLCKNMENYVELCKHNKYKKIYKFLNKN